MSYLPPYELGQPLKQGYLPENYDYAANDTRNRFKGQKEDIFSNIKSGEARVVEMVQNMTNDAPSSFQLMVAKNSA